MCALLISYVRFFDTVSLQNRRTATEGITGTAFSPRTPARPSRTNNCRAESASREDDDDDDHHDASTVPSAIVTNAVPFRLAQGLPRELGPLLFDANIDADILAGKKKRRNYSPASVNKNKNKNNTPRRQHVEKKRFLAVAKSIKPAKPCCQSASKKQHPFTAKKV